MTSARESFREPPVILSDGRFVLYSDGEWMAFSRDSKSWTTGVLDSRDLSTLIRHLPVMADNTLKLWEDVTRRHRSSTTTLGTSMTRTASIRLNSCTWKTWCMDGLTASFGSDSRRVSAVTNSDEPIYETADGEFALYEDGSWDALQDGRRVHGAAFDRGDMYGLAEELLRVAQTRIGLHDMDRIEAH